MSKEVLSPKSFLQISLFSISLTVSLISGCAVSAKNSDEKPVDKNSVQSQVTKEKTSNLQNVTKNSSSKNRIQITAGSPADTVRIFYKNLRERRFREAMMMTNLRAAIENLTEAEMQDLSTDFEPLANQVPADLEIKGEIVASNTATVTAKMPGEEAGKLELKEIQLRRENNAWVLLTADEKEEAMAKREGKNYFFALRIETHHGEVQNMMERIAKAQTVYAMQNGGTFANMQTLIAQGLLPADAQTTQSTGYRFSVTPSSDKKKYFATAEPAVYGKSGKLSFLLESDSASQKARLKAEDKKGMPLKK